MQFTCTSKGRLLSTVTQELFWPSHVGRCEGPPHSHVRMPFGLPSVVSAFQRNLRSILGSQEARHHAILAEMETVLREPPEPQSLLRLRVPVACEE